MKHSGEGLPLLYDAGHMAFAGGDVLRVIDKHHARISHVHTKDIRRCGDRRARPQQARAFSMPWSRVPSRCPATARWTSRRS